MLYRQTSRNFLTNQDLEQLEQIRSNTLLSATQRAEAIFSIVLEARLRLVNPEVASAVREMSRNFVGPTLGSTPSGIYYPIGGISVTSPLALMKSAVDYYIRIHELAHANQWMGVLRGQARPQLGRRGVIYYLQESDAMALEWQFLRQIPLVDRRALRELISSLPKIKGIRKLVLMQVLEDADLPFDQYVEKQRALGRYPKNRVLAEQAIVGFIEDHPDVIRIAFLLATFSAVSLALSSVFPGP